jgi:hypothetical protein
MARGRLKGARVEVLANGNPIDQVGLRMKGKSQRLTALLALLAIALPLLVLYYTQLHRLEGHIIQPTRAMEASKHPVNAPPAVDPAWAKPDASPPLAAGIGVMEQRMQAGDKAQAGMGGGRGGRPPGGGAPGGGAPGGAAGAPGPGHEVSPVTYLSVGGMPGEVLEFNLKKAGKEYLPEIPYVTPQNAYIEPEKDSTAGDYFARYAGETYNYMCNLPSLSFLLFLGLLGFTLVSWFANKSFRARLSKVVTVPGEPAVRGPHTREEMPVAVMPVD